MQRLVNDFILSDPAKPKRVVANGGVGFVDFPNEQWEEDGFWGQISMFLPVFYLMGMIYPVIWTTKIVVQEKEMGMVGMLKTNGVTQNVISVTHLISFTLFYVPIAVLSSLATASVFSNSSLSLIIALLVLFWISTITFSLFCASLFHRSKIGSIFAVLTYTAGYFVTYAQDISEGSRGALIVLSLHPLGALTYALEVMAEYEDEGVGLTALTAGTSPFPRTGYTYDLALGLMALSILITWTGAWYFERVLGVPRERLCFPFMPSYWLQNKRGGGGPLQTPTPSNDPEDVFMEKRALNVGPSPCVSVNNLVKTYGRSPVPSVDRLSLDIYPSEITSILGHNGAGKTSTFMCMTGMTEMTGGDVSVNGVSVGEQPHKAKRGIGYCPQHNILYDFMTCGEHVKMFGMIKGCDVKNVDSEVTEALRDVALITKKNSKSKNLSGGMKRKLLIAMSFIGESNVVFLDEPTSGMDVHSRRFIWSLVRKKRNEGRAVILSTHFLDEADVLSDRIAILSKGRLKCLGSPMFLKRAYGVGYQLTVENTRPPLTNVFDLARKVVPEAKLLTDVGTEVSIQLPTTSQHRFPALLREMEEVRIVGNEDSAATKMLHLNLSSNTMCSMNAPFPRLASLVLSSLVLSSLVLSSLVLSSQRKGNGEIVTFGVGVTTLESVFILIEEKAHEEEDHGTQGAPIDDGTDTAESDDLRLVESSEKKPSPQDPPQEYPVTNEPAPAALTSQSPLTFTPPTFLSYSSALISKRLYIMRRDKMAFFFSNVLPILFTALGFLAALLGSRLNPMQPYVPTLSSQNPGISGTQQNPVPFNGVNTVGTQFTCNDPTTCYNNAFASACSRQFYPSGNNRFCSQTAQSVFTPTMPADAEPIFNPTLRSVEEGSSYLQTTRGAFAATRYGAVWYNFLPGSIDTSSPLSATYSSQIQANCNSFLPPANNPDCAAYEGASYTVATNFTALHSSVLYQTVADNTLLPFRTNLDPNFAGPITTGIYPLPFTERQEKIAEASDAFASWFLVILSFPFISAAWIGFVVRERESGSKYLQKVSGVELPVYWLSTLAYDMLNYLVTISIIIGVMFAFQAKGLTTTQFDVVWGVITLFLLFGPASAGFTYLTSFFFKNPTSAMGFTIVANFLISLAGAMTCLILQVIDDGDGENTASVIIAWSLRWIPSFNLGHGIIYAINAVNIDYNVKTVFETKLILYDVIMLAIESVLYIVLVVWIDYYDGAQVADGLRLKVLRWLTCGCWKTRGGVWVCCSRCAKVDVDVDDDNNNDADGACSVGDEESQLHLNTSSALLPPDPEVVQEKERARAIEGGLDGGVGSHGGVIMVELSKTYRNGVTAVKGSNLSVREEVFGLLGTNGAGKTSSMKMLVGDESITSGSAYVNGFSCNGNMPGVRTSLGYCPQFDAVRSDGELTEKKMS